MELYKTPSQFSHAAHQDAHSSRKRNVQLESRLCSSGSAMSTVIQADVFLSYLIKMDGTEYLNSR